MDSIPIALALWYFDIASRRKIPEVVAALVAAVSLSI